MMMLGIFLQELMCGEHVQPLMQVPESACLIVDYVQGIQLPDHAWPRLRKGLQREEALPWDILLVCYRPQLAVLVHCIEADCSSAISVSPILAV